MLLSIVEIIGTSDSYTNILCALHAYCGKKYFAFPLYSIKVSIESCLMNALSLGARLCRPPSYSGMQVPNLLRCDDDPEESEKRIYYNGRADQSNIWSIPSYFSKNKVRISKNPISVRLYLLTLDSVVERIQRTGVENIQTQRIINSIPLKILIKFNQECNYQPIMAL